MTDILAPANVEHVDGCTCGWCRLRAGGKRGGANAGATRRARRARYLTGAMTTSERVAYEGVLAAARKAGAAGGAVASARLREARRRAGGGVEGEGDTNGGTGS